MIAVASACLGNGGFVCGVDDDKVHFSVQIDAGSQAVGENKQIILRRHFFVLKNLAARRFLLWRHLVFCVWAPHTNGLESCGNGGLFVL